jgi:hypothetical protein
MLDKNQKIGLIGTQQEDSEPSIIQKTLENKVEEKTLLDVHQLKEGQRVSIGVVLFKVQRVRPDLTIILKPVGKIKNPATEAAGRVLTKSLGENFLPATGQK